MMQGFLLKMKFDKSSDRIGPDCPFTHWKLYFKHSMKELCRRKFMLFSDSAEFRPGAYAIGCSKISLGNRVIIRPNTMLFADPRNNGAGIKIEDDVMIGSGVHFYVHDHAFGNTSIPIIEQGYGSSRPILVRNGAWIGGNAIILSGVTIGKNAVVGAGSVVTKNVPNYSVVVGSPAKVIRILEGE
jgi:acetyltransferase-like isoleucine patch superfamily enzyme